MRLSTKGRYSVRIMADLARHPGNAPRLIREIADSQQISEKYVGRLLLELQKAGLVASLRGVKGGYRLTKPAADISLLDIVEAAEGRLALVECVFNPAFCAKTETCPACPVWKSLSDKMRADFAAVRLDALANKG